LNALAESAPRAPATLGNQFASWLLGLTCFLWGTTQIAPPDAALDFSIGKIGVGDLTFALLAGMMIVTSPSFRAYCARFLERSRVFSLLMMLLAGLGLLSAFTNSVTRSLAPSDLIEVLRPALYLFIAIVASYYARLGYARVIALAFPLGIIGAGVNNMLLVITGDVEAVTSVLQPYNPNVVGNMLAVALVYLAIAFERGAQFRSTLLVLMSIVLIALSYSKGAWLMGLMGLGCFAAPYLMAARRRSLGVGTRWLVRLAVIAAFIVVAFNFEIISKMVELKFAQSFTSEVNQSQSTVALRVGHVYSSLEIVSRNPVFGVGVTNWEEENNGNAYWLNDVFLRNDNPHNGFFYVLAGMGIPALFVFLALTLFPVALLPRVLGLRGFLKQFCGICLLMILLISGNVMLHLLSHYFLWLLIGVCLGLSPETPPNYRKDATAAAEMPRL
jgi:O-antigen ligase